MGSTFSKHSFEGRKDWRVGEVMHSCLEYFNVENNQFDLTKVFEKLAKNILLKISYFPSDFVNFWLIKRKNYDTETCLYDINLLSVSQVYI